MKRYVVREGYLLDRYQDSMCIDSWERVREILNEQQNREPRWADLFGCGEMVVKVEFSNEKDEVVCCLSKQNLRQLVRTIPWSALIVDGQTSRLPWTSPPTSTYRDSRFKSQSQMVKNKKFVTRRRTMQINHIQYTAFLTIVVSLITIIPSINQRVSSSMSGEKWSCVCHCTCFWNWKEPFSEIPSNLANRLILTIYCLAYIMLDLTLSRYCWVTHHNTKCWWLA